MPGTALYSRDGTAVIAAECQGPESVGEGTGRGVGMEEESGSWKGGARRIREPLRRYT